MTNKQKALEALDFVNQWDFELREMEKFSDFDGVVEILRAALTEKEPGWQKIETAPKNGKFLAVWHGYKYVLVTHWNEHHKCWQIEPFSDTGMDETIDWPTHWMPLPRPPKGDTP